MGRKETSCTPTQEFSAVANVIEFVVASYWHDLSSIPMKYTSLAFAIISSADVAWRTTGAHFFKLLKYIRFVQTENPHVGGSVLPLNAFRPWQAIARI